MFKLSAESILDRKIKEVELHAVQQRINADYHECQAAKCKVNAEHLQRSAERMRVELAALQSPAEVVAEKPASTGWLNARNKEFAA